jgi:predicted NBD/HSP70 family sugar kinase
VEKGLYLCRNFKPVGSILIPNKPKITPTLDDDFRPAVLAKQQFVESVGRIGVPLIIGLRRKDGEFSRIETKVFPDSNPRQEENFSFVESLVKFLLWQRGGYQVYIGGSAQIADYLRRLYSPAGKRGFDAQFMGIQIYQHDFEVVSCHPQEVPGACEIGRHLGRHMDGCRIGFDLGASDRKVSALVDGKVIFSEEVIWEPGKQSDPEYHYREIMTSIQSAASRLPRVDAIGGSSAGIIIDNQPMVASLFRKVPPDRYHEIRNLFIRIRDEMNVPLEVINDGDVTALAGSMSLEDNGILGIALGSSQAAGYVGMDGQIMNWLNELAFAPIDINPNAPLDDWSRDTGCGASYLSQKAVFRLAPRAGIRIPEETTDAEKLKFVQEKLETGHGGAHKIWETIGVYLGYALAYYASFYDIKHILILGRCTSGSGGAVILEEARSVLNAEFPLLAAHIQVQLPDERSRRVGQAIAAASLPEIHFHG